MSATSSLRLHTGSPRSFKRQIMVSNQTESKQVRSAPRAGTQTSLFASKDDEHTLTAFGDIASEENSYMPSSSPLPSPRSSPSRTSTLRRPTPPSRTGSRRKQMNKAEDDLEEFTALFDNLREAREKARASARRVQASLRADLVETLGGPQMDIANAPREMDPEERKAIIQAPPNTLAAQPSLKYLSDLSVPVKQRLLRRPPIPRRWDPMEVDIVEQ